MDFKLHLNIEGWIGHIAINRQAGRDQSGKMANIEKKATPAAIIATLSRPSLHAIHLCPQQRQSRHEKAHGVMSRRTVKWRHAHYFFGRGLLAGEDQAGSRLKPGLYHNCNPEG